MAAGAGFLYFPPVSPDSRFGSHSEKCSGSIRGPRTSGVSVASTTTAPGQGISEGSAPEASLPSFEAVCHLQCATIRYIPQKARPSFARVLSDSLRSVCVSNSEEAWLKLFMLPKCVLRASLQGGHKHKSHSIEELFRLWSDGHLASLRQYASDHAGSPTPNHQRRKQKAKFSLQSTRPEKVYWERRARFSPLLGLPLRLDTCYSKSIPRVQFHHVRKSHYTIRRFQVASRLEIMSVLQQYPRDSVSGPSGL